MKISAPQMRAGRALVGWSQADLALASGLSRPTVERAETTGASDAAIEAMKSALELADVEFTNGGQPGVRLKSEKGFGYIYDDKHAVAKVVDGEVIDLRTKRKIAAVKRGNLIDLVTGKSLGHLANLAGANDEPLPAEFRKLLG